MSATASESEPDPAAALARPSARVAHLLAVARREFAAHGYSHVSVDGIARTAGVSKETIYRHFPDKAALFEAALAGIREAFSREIARVGDEAGGVADEDALEAFALAIYHSAAASGYLSVTWLAIANLIGFPALAARLRIDDMVGPLEPIRAAIVAYLARTGVPADRADRVTLEHAGDLGSMVVEGTRHIMGWPPLEGDMLRTHARAVVHLFLHGCEAAPAGRSSLPLPPPPALAGLGGEDAHAPVLPRPPGDHITTLMGVARRHFEDHGYRGASLDVIGAEARVGRGTLYRHFDGKAGLFEAVMLDAARQIAAEAAAALPAMPSGGDPAAVLLDLARAAARVLNGPGSIALHRSVIAEAKRAPRLARQVYATTRLGLMLPLTDWLAEGAAAGRFTLTDADWHARQFLLLATEGNRPLSRAAPTGDAHREAAARRAVATFLRGVGAAVA